MKQWALMLVAAALSACASSQQNANTARANTPIPTAANPPAAVTVVKALDPVGAYDFSTVANGQTVTGTLYITGTPGAYTGRIVTNVFPEIPVTSASVKDNAIDVKASMPDGELAIHFVMDGETFKGNWALGADTGDFNGKKQPKQ